MDKKTAMEIFNLLDKSIENPETELNYNNNFELLIAVILSAQCTDKRVNIVTDKLFKLYNKPEHFASMDVKELEKLIYSTGFYRNKAKNIIAASKKIMTDYNGEVPGNFADLVSLPGVGRKTANVLLSAVFNTPAIAVDTHVFRVANRLGLTNAKNVYESEMQLRELFDEEYYGKLHNLLVLHGRYVCTARNPKCKDYEIIKYCKYCQETLAKNNK